MSPLPDSHLSEWRLPYLDRLGVLFDSWRFCGCVKCRRSLQSALDDDYDRARN